MFEHLSNVLGKILLDNPKNAFDVFEHFSHEVKRTGYEYKKHNEHENLSK